MCQVILLWLHLSIEDKDISGPKWLSIYLGVKSSIFQGTQIDLLEITFIHSLFRNSGYQE